MHSLNDEVKVARARMGRAAFESLRGSWICFACHGVQVAPLPGNARDERERRCTLLHCKGSEACVPLEQAEREGWLEVTP